MKHIYHCDVCRYTFEYASLPGRCPDCGKVTAHGGTAPAVREATEVEITEFYRIQDEMRRELQRAEGGGRP